MTPEHQQGVLGAKQIAFTEIPVVDISELLSGDQDAAKHVAQQIGDACENVGFFYVKNHGISRDVTDELLKQTRDFFALPEQDKLRYDIIQLQRHRGFVAYGGLTAAVEGKPDVQEAYEVSVELPKDDKDYLAGNIMYGPNVWPQELPEFQKGVSSYYTAARRLGDILAQAFAITLDKPTQFFKPYMDKPITQLRLCYYPSQEGEIKENELGIGPHCDYEMFTILFQDDVGGLQVMNTNGDWVEAPPIPDTFVINIGDMLMRWTNNRFRSTPHRVINLSGKERYSFPMFVAANYDAIVRCLDTCTSNDNPPQYPPIQQGLWTVKQITEAYEYRREFRSEIADPERDIPLSV